MAKEDLKAILQWVNRKRIIRPNAEKPCHKTGDCPYGQLVEVYPLRAKRNKYSCKVFGHDCPVFYLNENMAE